MQTFTLSSPTWLSLLFWISLVTSQISRDVHITSICHHQPPSYFGPLTAALPFSTTEYWPSYILYINSTHISYILKSTELYQLSLLSSCHAVFINHHPSPFSIHQTPPSFATLPTLLLSQFTYIQLPPESSFARLANTFPCTFPNSSTFSTTNYLTTYIWHRVYLTNISN